jgi:hypothetical protein
MDDRAIAAAAALEERKVAMRCDGVRRGSRRDGSGGVPTSSGGVPLVRKGRGF